MKNTVLVVINFCPVNLLNVIIFLKQVKYSLNCLLRRAITRLEVKRSIVEVTLHLKILGKIHFKRVRICSEENFQIGVNKLKVLTKYYLIMN